MLSFFFFCWPYRKESSFFAHTQFSDDYSNVSLVPHFSCDFAVMKPILANFLILFALLFLLIEAVPTPAITLETDIQERDTTTKASSELQESKRIERRGGNGKRKKKKKKDEGGLPKYFHEPGGSELGNHYDSRFEHGIQDYADRKNTQLHMLRAYLTFFHENHLETWLAHGTLLGWWWNGRVRRLFT